MSRIVKTLALALVIAAMAAPAVFAKSLEPSLPPDARTAPAAQTQSADGEAAATVAISGLAVLFAGLALRPLTRRRRVPALS